MDQTHCDCIVIGGGPAGATAGAVLGRHGRKVIVLEKAKFPRYHIGESLMPCCYFPLERSGALEKVKAAAFVQKYSVQFVRMDGQVSQPFYFYQHLEHEAATTWQVYREQFDQILLDHARTCGAEVREQTQVTELIKDDSAAVIGVRALGPDGEPLEFRAPITIDASGRDAFFASKQSLRLRDPKLNKIAIWTYFRGAKRDSGQDEGATTVAYVPNKGWFWYIPLRDNRVSVGIVADRDYLYRDSRDPAEIFTREIQSNRWISQHLAHGQSEGQYWVTGEYSYRNRTCAVDGLVMAGDAFAFLDPVFSSGVLLALSSGVMAADGAHAALNSGDFSAGHFADYADRMCRGIENMRKLVYAFYDERFSFAGLTKKHPHLRGSLTDCLIGDLFDKDFKELFAAVGEFADLPEPLAHGRVEPLVPVSSS